MSKTENKPTIAVHIPKLLTSTDASDKQFRNELFDTLKNEGRGDFRVISIDTSKIKIKSPAEAKDFCCSNNLVLIVEHDSWMFSGSKSHRETVELLSRHVRFINPLHIHSRANDKIQTNKLLQEQGIPVLTIALASTHEELIGNLPPHGYFVIKPSDSGAGAGVRLVARKDNGIYERHNRKWKLLCLKDKNKGGESGIYVRQQNLYPIVLTVVMLALSIASMFLSLIFGCAVLMGAVYLFIACYDRGYWYAPAIVEPYFNDSASEFTSLRCTIIGNEVVEAVQRVNKKNITSNVARGGIAAPIVLTEEQKRIALAAKDAVGADYAGVDLLVRGNETVVGEVNIGPFTVYTKQTQVPVGRILGRYIIESLKATSLV